jgi:hypothetical protein
MDVHVKQRIARLSQRQLGLISMRQLIALGCPEGVVRRNLRDGVWVRIQRGAFKTSPGKLSREQQELAAFLLAGEGAVLSHFSAARKLGLAVPTFEDVHVTVPYERRGGRLEGTKIHRVKKFAKVLTTRRGDFRVTTIAQTIIDLAGVLDAHWLAVVLDSALVQRRAHLKSIIHLFLCQPPERPGMLRLGELLRERVGMVEFPESPLESLAFELSQKLNAKPVLQHPVVLPSGRTIHIDFAFPEHKLAVETDGKQDHLNDWAFHTDRHRDVDLAALGWVPIRFTWKDIHNNPNYFVTRVNQALAQRPGQSSAKPSFSPALNQP